VKTSNGSKHVSGYRIHEIGRVVLHRNGDEDNRLSVSIERTFEIILREEEWCILSRKWETCTVQVRNTRTILPDCTYLCTVFISKSLHKSNARVGPEVRIDFRFRGTLLRVGKRDEKVVLFLNSGRSEWFDDFNFGNWTEMVLCLKQFFWNFLYFSSYMTQSRKSLKFLKVLQITWNVHSSL